jgi:hypothetical protein
MNNNNFWKELTRLLSLQQDDTHYISYRTQMKFHYNQENMCNKNSKQKNWKIRSEVIKGDTQTDRQKTGTYCWFT